MATSPGDVVLISTVASSRWLHIRHRDALDRIDLSICLDTGIPAYAAEDPLVTCEVLAPYTLTTQARDTRVWATERGATAQWVPFGDGNVGIETVIDYFIAHAPAAPINLEVITGRAPQELQYVDPSSEFWPMYPGMLAATSFASRPGHRGPLLSPSSSSSYRRDA